MCLVVCACAVVAGLKHLHRVGNHGVVQLRHPRHDGIGHVNRVFSRFFGHGHRDGCIFAAARLVGQAMPDITAGRQRAVCYRGHVFEEHRATLAHAHYQVGHVAGLRQIRACLDGDALVSGNQLTHRHARVGRLQRHAQRLHGDAGSRHAARIHLNPHRTAGAAQCLHFTGAGDALYVRFDTVRHPLQVVGAGRRIFAVERQRDDGHVINALGLDDGLHHAQAFGQPVGVVLDGVVQSHQGFCARHAHFELHRQHRHAGA